jgi:hypothetical protein
LQQYHLQLLKLLYFHLRLINHLYHQLIKLHLQQ